MEITIRDLRKALYLLSDHSMTVKELREVLFDVSEKEQDRQLSEDDLMQVYFQNSI